MGEAGLTLYAVHDIGSTWNEMEPYIKRALDRTQAHKDYSPEDIRAMLEARSMQAYVGAEDGIKAVFITQVLAHPKRKVLLLFLASSDRGTYDDWSHFFWTARDIAASQGCSAIRTYGRLGWQKVLSDDWIKSGVYEVEI